MAGNAAMTIFIGGDNSDFLKKWESTKRALKKGLGQEAMAMSESIATGFAAAAAAIGAVGLASIKMAADMQANKKAFSTLLGDSQKAEKFLGDLARFAAETPFELPGLVTASKKLLAYGFAVQDIIPMMAAIGDAAAMLGMGQEGIDRMTLAVGQMQAKGKVSGEEMRQLAEAGVPAWKFLADAIGKDIPTAMKLAESGAIDSTTGINAILTGMQSRFKGGMEGLSQEIPGLFSTIKDNVAAVMREMGDKLIESLDLKTRMKALAESLDAFAGYVKNNGINAALKDLIPKELSLAIFSVAGALVGAAIPAIVSFGVSLWTALAPLAPFLAAGAALGAVAWVIWQAWEPLGQLFGNVWTAAVAYTQEKWAQLKALVFGGVASVISAVMPLLRLFGGGLHDAAATWLAGLSESAASASSDAAAAAERVQSATTGIKNAFDGVKEKLTSGVKELKNTAAKLNTTFKGLSGGTGNAAASGSGAGDWDRLVKKAEQVSKAIEDQWVQTTKTEIEQLERWREQQLAALEETLAANENYQRDLERLEATYSVRRQKIAAEEVKKKNNIWDQAADAARVLRQKLGSIGLTGVEKQKFEIETDAASQVEAIQRKYRDWSAEYASATKAQQEQFRAAWTANGIQFEMTESGFVTFQRQIAAEQIAVEQEKNQKLQDLHYARTKFQEDLDRARADGEMQRVQELLSTEQALQAQQLAGKQQYIDAYYKIWQDAHRSAMSYMAEATSGLYDGLQGFFSDVISGTKSIGEAWSDLGKRILKIIADIAAQWLASQIMTSLFGGLGGLFGGAANGKTPGLRIPKFALGGEYAGGLALVGERGPELVNFNRGGRIHAAPETRRMLSQGERASTVVFNIRTPDADSFRKSQRQLMDQAKRSIR